MLADDGARRAKGDDALRSALERVGNAGESASFADAASGADPDGAMLAARLDRLGSGSNASRDARGPRIAALAASVVLVAVPLAGYAAILGIVP